MDNKKYVLAAAVAALGIYGAWTGIPRSHADDGGDSSGGTVFIQDAPLVQKALPVTLSAYGTVQPDINQTVNVVVPRAGQVSALAVEPGAIVTRGQKLFQFTTDPAALMAYQQAVSAAKFARDDLARTNQLYAAKLATASQLDQARKALSDANEALAAQQKIGAGHATQWVTAPANGVITAVTAKVGDQLSQGGAVMQLTENGGLEVVLGVQPEKIGKVHAGMPVTLVSPFDDSVTVTGKIAAVHGMIDPNTRLADAIVKLDGKDAGGLMAGMTVSGTITTSTFNGYVVPRPVVLSDDNGSYVFQVNGTKAVRVNVKVEADNGDQYGISGKLDPKEPVVTLGNAELTDGQAIRMTENSSASDASSGSDK